MCTCVLLLLYCERSLKNYKLLYDICVLFENNSNERRRIFVCAFSLDARVRDEFGCRIVSVNVDGGAERELMMALDGRQFT